MNVIICILKMSHKHCFVEGRCYTIPVPKLMDFFFVVSTPWNYLWKYAIFCTKELVQSVNCQARKLLFVVSTPWYHLWESPIKLCWHQFVPLQLDLLHQFFALKSCLFAPTKNTIIIGFVTFSKSIQYWLSTN